MIHQQPILTSGIFTKKKIRIHSLACINSGFKKIVFGAIKFCDQELARLQDQAAALQTARMAYAKALNDALPAMHAGDTLTLN